MSAGEHKSGRILLDLSFAPGPQFLLVLLHIEVLAVVFHTSPRDQILRSGCRWSVLYRATPTVGTNFAIKLDSFGRGARVERSERALTHRVQNDTLFQKKDEIRPPRKKKLAKA